MSERLVLVKPSTPPGAIGGLTHNGGFSLWKGTDIDQSCPLCQGTLTDMTGYRNRVRIVRVLQPSARFPGRLYAAAHPIPDGLRVLSCAVCGVTFVEGMQ